MTNSKTFKIARNNDTGRIDNANKAKLYPKRYTLESMPKSGFGDTN